jgi:phage gp16-like protein
MNQDEYMEQNFKARPRFSGQRMGRLKSGKTVQDEISPEDLERIRAFMAGRLQGLRQERGDRGSGGKKRWWT